MRRGLGEQNEYFVKGAIRGSMFQAITQIHQHEAPVARRGGTSVRAGVTSRVSLIETAGSRLEPH